MILRIVKIWALVVFFSLARHTDCFATDSDEDHVRETEKHFVQHVLPILQAKCFACHGKNGETKGELDLTSKAGMLRGGESGDAAITPGDPSSSLLIAAIKWDGLEMPPKENDRLSNTQITALEKWLRDGAVWPESSTQSAIRQDLKPIDDGEIVKTSGGLSEEWTNRRYQPEDIWALRPLKKPAPPTGGYNVDSFIDEQLKRAGVAAAGIAKPDELIRRATYNLTGLPPTPEQIDQFNSSYASNPSQAWNSLIDRLLDSPHYGERWGQHWLDVVRYADTAGFSNDFELSNAWRYRDYVIRSFNNDVPYNEFVIQQLAGDEWYEEQSTGNKPLKIEKSEAQIATGLLRTGPWEHTPMTPDKLSRQNYLDDLVNGIGQSFLSTPLRCCKCHDHKYDPIPTRDYYRIYAAFKRTQPAEMKADFLEHENLAQFDSQKRHVEKLLQFARENKDRLYAKREKAAKAWYRENGIPEEYVPWSVRKMKDFTGPKPPRHIGITAQEEGEIKVREQDEKIWERRLERFQPLVQSVYNGPDFLQESRKLRPPNRRKLKSEKEATYFIYAGGDVYAESEAVTSGVLSCVGIPTTCGSKDDPFALACAPDRRRLELARWITNPDNGLAVRSIVNRIWHYHFGKGIAENPNNLGASGAKPTHPELLDWLCIQFLQNNWSIKSLHKTIMQSQAYIRSTHHPNADELNILDPENHLLAVFSPRRLTAEEYRDTLLSISGELNSEIGGLPIRPEINREVALSPRMIQFSISPAYQPEPHAKDRNRRSIYAYRVRGLRNPLLEVLDQPNPNESCELRDDASTAPQVFAMMNGEYTLKRSIAFAKRLRGDSSQIDEQIRSGFRLAAGVDISNELLNTLREHFEAMLIYHRNQKPEPLTYPTKVTRSLVEEFTGEKFEYVEWLDSYEDYQADDGPSDVDAETRALADVCLLIMNSNQLMYIY